MREVRDIHRRMLLTHGTTDSIIGTLSTTQVFCVHGSSISTHKHCGKVMLGSKTLDALIIEDVSLSTFCLAKDSLAFLDVCNNIDAGILHFLDKPVEKRIGIFLIQVLDITNEGIGTFLREEAHTHTSVKHIRLTVIDLGKFPHKMIGKAIPCGIVNMPAASLFNNSVVGLQSAVFKELQPCANARLH